MRTQTILGCLVASISLLSWCHDGLAQNEPGGDLQSVLKSNASTDDLRLLIDLDVPIASDPIETTDSTAIDPATDSATTVVSETAAEQIATPTPIDNATSAPANVAQPNPIDKKTDAVTTSSATKIPDPIFDLGLIIRDDVANSTPIVRGVLVGSPAALAGVRSGDKIRAVGKNPTRSSYGLSAELVTTNSSKFDLTIQRDGKIRVLKLDKDAVATNAISSATSAVSPIPGITSVASPPPIATAPPAAPIPARTLNSVVTPRSVVTPNSSATPIATRSPAPPAPVPVRRQVRARPAAYSTTPQPVVTARPATTQRPTTTSTIVPPPRPRPISPQTTRYRPTPVAPRPVPNPTSVLTQRNPSPQSARPTSSVVQRRAIPAPTTTRPPVVVQQRVVRVVPQPRTVGPQPVIRGQGPARPLIGDGGRFIGNGRVINSTLRLFGR